MAQGRNPFFVEPASPMQGFQGLMKSVSSRTEFLREQTKEKQLQTQVKEGMEILRTGTSEQMEDFISLNPEAGERIITSIGTMDVLERKETLNAVNDVLMGIKTPEQFYTDEAKEATGEEAVELQVQALQAKYYPEEAILQFEKMKAVLDPKGSKEYREATAPEKDALKDKMALAKYKSELDAKYKDTPEGKLEKAKKLAEYKEGLGVPIEAPAEKLQRDKDLAKFKADLDAKYKDTSEGKLEKQKELAEYKAGLTTKDAKLYLLPDGSTALSYDGGRTYEKEGKKIKMPDDAQPASITATEREMGLREVQRRAQERIDKRRSGEIAPITEGDTKTLEERAEKGTGPYRKIFAFANDFFGGLGADLLLGRKELFKDTQENRQVLRLVKQVGKRALVNNRRFPVKEMESVDALFADPDKLFRNPRTEAGKFRILRNYAREGLDFNDQMLAAGGLSSEMAMELMANSMELEKFLALLGPGSEGENTIRQFPDITTQEEFDALPSGITYIGKGGKKRRKP